MTKSRGGPGFWILLYSVATLAVFLSILVSQTEGGRAFLNSVGAGGAPVLDAGFRSVYSLWDAFLAWLPPEYRPGSAN